MTVNIADRIDEIVAAGRTAQSARSAERLLDGLARGCWIYGAGGYGRTISRLLTAAGIACEGHIDRGADKGALGGLDRPVVAPGAVSPDQARGRTLILALHNFAVDQTPVMEWARALGFADILLPADLPDLLGAEAGSYWLSGRSHVLDHVDPLAKVLELMADPLSVEVVAGLARFRATGDLAAHPASCLAEQYFPDDLPLPNAPLRVIDGGAFTGDLLPGAARAGARIEAWFAFEPDPQNFDALAKAAAATDIPQIALFPCGLSDHNGEIRFAAGGVSGSHAQQDGEISVRLAAVDQVLVGAHPNFVKLDIEGAEREALDGMANTLSASRPRLAMSIYHRPEDLWELPLKIHAMLPDHRLHVRQHGYNGFDTVLYAVP